MADKQFHLWKDWRLHLIVLGIVFITESIGTHKIPVGSAVILLLPMLYAMVIGVGLYFTPVVKEKQSKNAETLVFLAVSLLVAKFSLGIGPSFVQIIEAGPALLLQEIGNLGTIFLALPVAVALGMKRESIGMTHSTGREGNLALIMDYYGFNSPEGRGVMAMYIFGTVFGAVFLGLIAGVLASVTPIHPLALAMASGVGSGSMMAASSGSLVSLFPEMEQDIMAFAAASNLISISTGLYVSIFIGLPMTEKLYTFFSKMKGSKAKSNVNDVGA
ncbi:Protein of unknown function [Halobacillus karajensis]|uniref:DUF3100 domain-containing protein n=1 Tax=Halobacillus karajensis TaxID=195088 RepID=UPI0008A74153|nr:DUF3100 domain-containing protein [Halobacillus karajensis]SEI14136.1 Protein of unknown function [Halobacillus karajensis]